MEPSSENNLPNLYLYREELQQMEDACQSSNKHDSTHSHEDSCFLVASLTNVGLNNPESSEAARLVKAYLENVSKLYGITEEELISEVATEIVCQKAKALRS